MFGEITADLEFLRLRKGTGTEEALAELMKLADQDRIERFEQYPLSVLVFTVDRQHTDCGTIYLFDRREGVWIWIEFKGETTKQGYSRAEEYSPGDFDILVNRCGFRLLAEDPRKLREGKWFIRVEEGTFGPAMWVI